MKIVLVIVIVVCGKLSSIAQIPDSTSLDTAINTPAIIYNITDPLGIEYTSNGPYYHSEPVPTCSCLKSKSGQFYYENDSLPYHGVCIVVSTAGAGHFPYQRHRDDHTGQFDIRNFTLWGQGHIKIISYYTNGKRHGNREYFDKKGKLLRTELYQEGVLIKTIFP